MRAAVYLRVSSDKQARAGTIDSQRREVPARCEREGWAIVTAVPSCTLMFKQELPLMFPDEADVQLVKAAMFDPFEYFVARHKDGLLKLDFKAALGKVSYHIPCHGRVQKIGKKTVKKVTNITPKVGSKVKRGSTVTITVG